MRVKELFAWIKERQSIWVRKFRGERKPWTRDAILQQYRFCNVYRELDTVTQWINVNWRTPHAADQHLWFAMVVARLFNVPHTLQAIGYPAPWRPATILKGIAQVRNRQLTVFNSAYIVSTNGRKMDKVSYLLQHVLAPLWENRKPLAHMYTHKGMTLQEFHRHLTQFDGLGSFMAAQVVADIKYAKPLLTAQDWYTWAASGPGSRRGLNRVVGRELDAPWREVEWLGALHQLHLQVEPLIKRADLPMLHAQDLQNCLCEFDKYERTRLGQGRPRSTYPGGK